MHEKWPRGWRTATGAAGAATQPQARGSHVDVRSERATGQRTTRKGAARCADTRSHPWEGRINSRDESITC